MTNVIDFPLIDLKSDIEFYVEDEKTLLFKKLKNEEWKKKEADIKKKVLFEMEIKQKDEETLKSNKEFEKKNVTADSTGKTITIKPFPNEKFLQDFLFSRGIISNKSLITFDTTDERFCTKKINPIIINVTEEKIEKIIIIPKKTKIAITNTIKGKA